MLRTSESSCSAEFGFAKISTDHDSMEHILNGESKETSNKYSESKHAKLTGIDLKTRGDEVNTVSANKYVGS
jgi:hypothetical protein